MLIELYWTPSWEKSSFFIVSAPFWVYGQRKNRDFHCTKSLDKPVSLRDYQSCNSIAIRTFLFQGIEMIFLSEYPLRLRIWLHVWSIMMWLRVMPFQQLNSQWTEGLFFNKTNQLLQSSNSITQGTSPEETLLVPCHTSNALTLTSTAFPN